MPVSKTPERRFPNCRTGGFLTPEYSAVLKAIGQKLAGAVKVGSDSSLTLELTEGSSFTGSIDGSITDAEGKTVSTETGAVTVTLDSTSTWTLTADSYVTELSGSTENIDLNGYTLYVSGTPFTAG